MPLHRQSRHAGFGISTPGVGFAAVYTDRGDARAADKDTRLPALTTRIRAITDEHAKRRTATTGGTRMRSDARYIRCMHTHLMDDGATAANRASQSWSRVATFASAVDASVDRWLADTYRVGLTEYRALSLLSAASDKELRIAALAQRVGLTSTSTTRLVSRLETKGLARRDACTDDGRGVYAVIDEPGEVLLREVHDPYEARVNDLLSNAAKHFPHIDSAAVAGAIKAVGALLAS